MMNHLLKLYYGFEKDIHDHQYFTHDHHLYYFMSMDPSFFNLFSYYQYALHLGGLPGYQIVFNYQQEMISQNHILLVYEKKDF